MQSPLADSNRGPPPYHAGEEEEGDEGEGDAEGEDDLAEDEGAGGLTPRRP